MRRLSMKAKKGKAEHSGSESNEDEKQGNGSTVAAVASGDEETGSEDAKLSTQKKKNKRGKKGDTSQKTNEDGVADEAVDSKRKRRSTAAKTEGQDEKQPEPEEYEVESVVDSRVVRLRTQYKIRWKGFGPENDTWEPEEDLSCPELIQEFLNSQPEGAKGKNAKNKKRGNKSNAAESKNKKKKVEETAEEEEEGGGAAAEDGEKVYEVDKVMEVHFKKNGKREFLIRWKGFSQNDDTWEPEENLSCPELIEKFMAKVDKGKKRR